MSTDGTASSLTPQCLGVSRGFFLGLHALRLASLSLCLVMATEISTPCLIYISALICGAALK